MIALRRSTSASALSSLRACSMTSARSASTSSGRSASMSMEALNQPITVPSTSNLWRLRPASAMHAPPVQPLQKSTELRRRQAHHPVPDARPLEATLFELLGHEAQARSVPPDQLDPVAALRPEDIDHARKRITAILGSDQRR